MHPISEDMLERQSLFNSKKTGYNGFELCEHISSASICRPVIFTKILPEFHISHIKNNLITVLKALDMFLKVWWRHN